VYERFDEDARQVLVLAKEEARALGHRHVGSEHLLLGLLRLPSGAAVRVLAALGVALEDVRAAVLEAVEVVGTPSEDALAGELPFTVHAKRVLELALQVAIELHHEAVGTEHILLGLARDRTGVACRILTARHAHEERIRDEVLRLTGTSAPGAGSLLAGPWLPRSPALSPEFLAELERVRAAKARALEEQDFDVAAHLRDRERALADAGRALEDVWFER
jgi:ATP-dependent Clp protease ATP-binding subunit ClpC